MFEGEPDFTILTLKVMIAPVLGICGRREIPALE